MERQLDVDPLKLLPGACPLRFCNVSLSFPSYLSDLDLFSFVSHQEMVIFSWTSKWCRSLSRAVMKNPAYRLRHCTLLYQGYDLPTGPNRSHWTRETRILELYRQLFREELVVPPK